jgi:hypothetical protein
MIVLPWCRMKRCALGLSIAVSLWMVGVRRARLRGQPRRIRVERIGHQSIVS